MRKIPAILSLICLAVVLAYAQTTEFTYQGSLKDGANLANGNYDFEFALYDGGGIQLGGAQTRNGVAVANGIFSVSLDFGNQFSGGGRLLEIRVRLSGGGGFTTLTPRQPLNSSPYSVKSLISDTATTATNAVNAVNATTAANFTGSLSGDVTGTQNATTVARIQNRTVAPTAPLAGQVLKYNGTQWVPDTDIVGSGGGGGTITGVTPGTGLTGGGATGNVTLGIANSGVGTTQLADGSVTGAKIPTGQVVKNLNGIQDSVTLAAGSNISITPSGNTLTIASTGGGGGGGTITGVTAGTGLTGGGATGNVTIGIGPGGVGTGQLAEGSVVDSKIVTVSGAKVIGQVTDAFNATNAANATTATNATQLGGVAANQYLQTNGNGSGLTNLNANNITTGTLANARLGQIPTANIADSAVTSAKIAGGQVTKSVNGLTDNVTLAAGSNISITPSGNTLTIASTGGGGVSGSGIAGQIALWNGTSSLGVAQISQSGGNIGIGTTVAPTDPLTVQSAMDNYGVVHKSGSIAVGTFVGGSTGGGWFGTRSFHPLSFFAASGGPSLTIATNGKVGIGLSNPGTRLEVVDSTTNAGTILARATGSNGIGVYGISSFSLGIGVLGQASGSGDGVVGQTENGTGVDGFSNFGKGVEASVTSPGAIALKTQGTSFFKGDTTPLTVANAGSGMGIAIGTSGTLGYISTFDYSTNQTGTLLLNNGGGRVGINTNTPDQALSVNGNASKAGGGSWLAFSDERLKNIKGRFNGGLKAVMKLQPLRYEYKKDNAIGLKSDGEHVGFSAQAVEKIIPEAVTKTEQGYRLVNNDPIIWAMLNAIKEQQATIEKLTKQMRKLQRSRKRR